MNFLKEVGWSKGFSRGKNELVGGRSKINFLEEIYELPQGVGWSKGFSRGKNELVGGRSKINFLEEIYELPQGVGRSKGFSRGKNELRWNRFKNAFLKYLEENDKFLQKKAEKIWIHEEIKPKQQFQNLEIDFFQNLKNTPRRTPPWYSRKTINK